MHSGSPATACGGVALGGGGYDLTNVARAWTAAWAAMNDVELPSDLPRESHRDMQRLGLGTLSLNDPVEVLPPPPGPPPPR